MKNFVQKGAIIEIAAPAALTSGQPLLIGSMFGVTASAAANGEPCSLHLVGVYQLPKRTSANSDEAWSIGDPIYWNASAAAVSKVAAPGNRLVGVATSAAPAAATTGTVRLNGTVVPAALPSE